MADDPLYLAEQWLAAGRGVVLATVMSTWGSAPRPAGSVMAIRDDGVFAGSVSAGCVEGAVIEAALAALKDGKLQRLAYGVADSTAWSAGLTCGGAIAILVEPLATETARATLMKWNAMRRHGAAAVRAVQLETGETRVIAPDENNDLLSGDASDAARRDRSSEIVHAGAAWFLTVANPPVDLVIVGAVHIAQALVRMAVPLGYRIRVIDPRRTFASEERFPGIVLAHDYTDEVLTRTPLNRRSALVALAHDAKIDDPALIAALHSPAFYVGALGSQKTQTLRRERLLAAGVSAADLARLHGPVGLPIGSKTPEEIAISILADIIRSMRGA